MKRLLLVALLVAASGCASVPRCDRAVQGHAGEIENMVLVVNAGQVKFFAGECKAPSGRVVEYKYSIYGQPGPPNMLPCIAVYGEINNNPFQWANCTDQGGPQVDHKSPTKSCTEWFRKNTRTLGVSDENSMSWDGKCYSETNFGVIRVKYAQTKSLSVHDDGSVDICMEASGTYFWPTGQMPFKDQKECMPFVQIK